MKLAIIFPGQGSQSPGMLAELAAEFSIVEQTFAEASAALHYDLWKLVQQGPAQELNQTWKTQPALLAASVAIWRIWQSKMGRRPAMMAGHSLGEYSALVCAGVLDFQQTVSLVELRGKLMQEAMPEGTGAMSAILGLDDGTVTKACAESAWDQIVAPANFNAPGQVVIAGHQEAVKRVELACKAMGARVLGLPVSVPSHCVVMKSAADTLAMALEKIDVKPPQYPVVNNVDVKTENTPDAIRSALVRQLYHPVRWTESVEYIAAMGVEKLLEAGPGNVLVGLTRRITGALEAVSINTIAKLSEALA